MKKKITMLLTSLLCCVGASAKIDGTVTGVTEIPSTPTAPSAIETGYYLLKEVNPSASGKPGGFMKAASEAIDAVVTPIGSSTSLEAANVDATHIWYIEKNGETYTISTANCVASWQAPATHQKNLVAYASKGTLTFVAEEVTIDNTTATPEENTFIVQNEGKTACVHYSNNNLGSWTNADPTSVMMFEAYLLPEENITYVSHLVTAKNNLSSLITTAQETYNGLTDKTFAEAIALNTAIATAQGVYDNSEATLDEVNAQITALTAAKEAAALYPFVESALKTIEAGKYFIYYTDTEGTKHYLQTSDENNVVTVTENPVSYEIAAGTVQSGKYTKAYTLKMNDLYISNTDWNTTAIKTESPSASLWKSQVIFEKDGKAAIRLTNATDIDSWHGNYFINSGTEEGTTIAADPSLGDALFIWTIEADLQSMRDEMAALKDEATALKATLEAVQPVTTPVTDAIAALTEAISYAETNASSNDMEVLNIGISQLTAANSKANASTFEGGALAVLEEGEYVVYYVDANGTKHYLVNNKTTRRAVTSTVASVYDVTLGNVNGYAAYAYYFDMNGSKISNPTNDEAKEVQVENKGGYNYGDNRTWDSQVLYVNAEGKYAIRSTNCVAGSGWSSDCFITVSEDGATVSGQNTDLTDALYKWNVAKASEANIAYTMNIDEYKYMTLYLNYAANVPDGVTAYAVSGVENGELNLVAVGDVIPENTPVIVEGNANAYSFAYADPVDAYAGTNLLKGTWFDSYVTPTTDYDAYVMALDEGNGRIVMGKAQLNANGGTTQFKNRANKAYLELPQEVAAGAAMFSFGRGEGTTGIETAVNGEQTAVIYDLAGRRVEKMEKGIYIVNGKKVIR